MGRISLTIVLFIFALSNLFSQCPDLPNNTTLNGSTNTDLNFCGTASAMFEVNDPNLPSGTIDWYSSTTSGFDPLTTGTLLGSSNITNSASPCDPGGCPSIEVIYIDACDMGNEGKNEFMVISSGSGFAVDDLSVTFDMNNTFGSAGNGNINVGGACGWLDGDLGLFSGCGFLVSVGPGDYIPPNSAVIIQTSNFGTTTYDISAMCGVSECIYVLRNSCDRGVGAFTNCGGGVSSGSTRNNEIALTCGCNDVLVYDILDPAFLNICSTIGDDGMHVFSDLTYANNLCNNGPILNSISQFPINAVTDPFSHSFTDTECNTTQYVVGVLNSDQFNEDCCSEQITEEYAFDIACINAELQGMADLCPGECEDISVLIDGGEAPYSLNLTLSGLPFPLDNIMIPFPGFPINETITICFDSGGPLIDPVNFIIDLPAAAGGLSASLTLNSITDNTGCAGDINGSSIALNFNDAPDINNPGPQETCDLGNGSGIFILSDLTDIINGNSGATVNYYSDIAATMPISDPYTTSGGSIYAQIEGNPCNSEIIEIPLIIVANGNAGLVSFFCNDPIDGLSSMCSICDDDGVLGEEISLTVIFENPALTYDYEIVWTRDSGGSSVITGTTVGSETIVISIDETSTFAVSVVTVEGDCADFTDLGDIVTYEYSLQPDLDAPQNLSDCQEVALPDITGGVVPSNAAYFSEPDGMGIMYQPGDLISSTTTLYLYAGIPGCEQEFQFDVSIDGAAMIDNPMDVTTCGVYALPEITGTNVDNAGYYTETNGGGNQVNAGTLISTSTTLFLYDPICGGNQPTLDITITPGPIIENNTDTIVCESYIVEPIIGIDLSGNEMYFDTTGGNGMMINVGDTLRSDTIIFIYDNTNGCEVEVPIVIDIREPGYPGLDTAIVLCEGDPTLIDINDALGGPLPDTTGIWFDVNNTDVIQDSTQVDFSGLGTGTYLYEYQIMDSICVDTHSILTVNIIDTPDAGQDATLSICSDTIGVNVFDLLGNPDLGGVFFDTDTDLPATFDPTNATFAASTIGSTAFIYVVGNPGTTCGSDTSDFLLVVQENVDAGDDNIYNSCSNESIDLTTLLINASDIGTFSEASPSGGLTANNFDTGNVPNGTYPIFHILSGSGDCPTDTAMITIFVSDGANAGNDNMIQLCGDSTLSLMSLIDGDAGGRFYFNDQLLASGEITYTSESGTFEYEYIVGDGIACPSDTAILEVTRFLKPASFLDITLQSLCNEDCTTVSFNAANTGGQTVNVFYHIESNSGEVDNREQDIGDLMPNVEITFCIGIGDLSANILQPGTEYTFILDSISTTNPDCVFLDGQSVTFNTFVSSTSTLTGEFCIDDVVLVGDDIYDQNMTMGTTTIPNGSVTGCDSIIVVDLTFTDEVIGFFTEELCEGDSVEVNGVIYKETNTTDEFTIPNGSVNGCDSLVRIDITFFETTIGTITETICAGDTVFINGEAFFEGKELETQLLENQNTAGCDSLVEVTILIDDPISGEVSGSVCATYEITINDNTYNQSNPSGIELLPNQASNGCDSIVQIDLAFDLPAIDSTLTIATCDEDFTITVGSETFDSSNLSGSVTLPANGDACDTLIEVNLSFGELGIDFLEVDGGCAVPDSGRIVIESTTGDLPLDIFYNGNSAVAFVLPWDVQLPVGMGEMSITDASGCMTMIDFELFPGGEENLEITENQGQISVSGTMIDSISWSPVEGLSCTNCVDPIATPEISTTYTATVFFDDSCMVDLMIDIIVIDDTPDYILPSGFSPNGDNVNDNFFLTITEGATGIPQDLRIYDRWGNLVHQSAGEQILTEGWDGTRGGSDVAAGVYVYQLTILNNEQVISIYGDVTVVR